MELNFFILGGYGQFVWPSFIFSYAICYYFYFKTKRELKKQEELFSKELKALEIEKVNLATRDRKIKKIYQLS